MARRSVELEGVRWSVDVSGRTTQYAKDEVGLVFRALGDPDAKPRIIRFSPRGVRSPELALARLTDAELRALLERAQPAWTSPDLGYAR